MIRALAAFALLASASAFMTARPGAAAARSSALKMGFETEIGAQPPLGFWDPLGLLKEADQERFDRLRYVEVKHGRIAQLAILGHLVNAAGIRLPGLLSPSANLKFADVPFGLKALSVIPPAAAGELAMMRCVGLAGAVAVASLAGRGAAVSAAPQAEDCEEPACAPARLLQDALRGAAGSGAARAGRECPMNKDELGRAAWGLMHTTAAYFPEEPSDEDKLAAHAMISGMAQLYPCSYCQADFIEQVHENPPDLQSRAAFLLWTCRLHNHVNERLGRPPFPCEEAALMARWRKGGGACAADAQGSMGHH